LKLRISPIVFFFCFFFVLPGLHLFGLSFCGWLLENITCTGAPPVVNFLSLVGNITEKFSIIFCTTAQRRFDCLICSIVVDAVGLNNVGPNTIAKLEAVILFTSALSETARRKVNTMDAIVLFRGGRSWSWSRIAGRLRGSKQPMNESMALVGNRGGTHSRKYFFRTPQTLLISTSSASFNSMIYDS